MPYSSVAMPKLSDLSTILEESVFANIDTDNIEKLARILECGKTAAGEYVYQMGDTAHALFIVVSGKVAVCDPMKHTILSYLTQGDAFGMLSLFFNSDVSPDVRAVEDSTFLILDSGTLRMIEVSDPSLAIVLLRCVRKAIGELVSQVSPIIMRLAL